MTSHNRKTTEEIARRRGILETARRALHEEFIGVGPTIDAIIRDISPWFLFPELLSRPVVINLWGMTGVGKTSLVNRLVELIGFQQQYFRFDLGDKHSSFSLQESYVTLSKRIEDLPMILAFDEVHHARSLDPMGNEVSEDRNRPMWELLDTGTIQSINWNRYNSIENQADIIEGLLKKGVRITNGEFVSGLRQAELELERNFKREKCKLFVSMNWFDTIIALAGEDLNIRLKSDLEKLLRTFSGSEAVQFLRMVESCGVRTVVKRFPHLLVFVMGNLDEVFTMSSDFSADRDAEIFYRKSLEITIPQVKEALKARFRSEQIARLGNTHIIFPAIQKTSFERVIEMELRKMSDHVRKRFDIRLEFGETVHRLIYAEGVYPTQGYRPLFSTIHQLLKGNVASFLSAAFESSVQIERIVVSVENKQLSASFHSAAGEAFTRALPLPTPLTDLRQSTRDDQQAVVAVHESGHGILHMVLEKKIPPSIHSVTSDHDGGGFMTKDEDDSLMTRQHILHYAASMFGGFAAEKLVFGRQEITAGSGSDIERATGIVCTAFNRWGVGKHPFHIQRWLHEKEAALHDIPNEDEIIVFLQEALSLAESTLKTEWRLLLELSDYLSEHRLIEEEKIRSLCREYSTTGLPDSIPEGRIDTGHRRRLKRLVAELGAADDTPPWPAGLEERLRRASSADLPLAAEG